MSPFPAHEYSPDPDRKDFVPGDRVRMENHKWRDGIDEGGLEGSNVIYLGKDGGGNQLFLHMDGARVEKFEGLRKTVRGYSPSDQWDPIYKYKFVERYAPRLPSWLTK